jgi:hypothetical protein
MSRMKAHWPERINPQLELKSARRWLENELRPNRYLPSQNADIYRVIAILEAITLIDNALDAFTLEANNRERFRASAGV